MWRGGGGGEYYSLVPSSLGSRRGGLAEAMFGGTGGGGMRWGVMVDGSMDHCRWTIGRSRHDV